MTTTTPSPTRRTPLAAALALLALLLSAGAAAPAAAPAKAKAKAKCPSVGTTVAKSSQARIYMTQVKGETRTYGCWLATGDRLRLDERCDPDDGSPSGADACDD